MAAGRADGQRGDSQTTGPHQPRDSRRPAGARNAAGARLPVAGPIDLRRPAGRAQRRRPQRPIHRAVRLSHRSDGRSDSARAHRGGLVGRRLAHAAKRRGRPAVQHHHHRKPLMRASAQRGRWLLTTAAATCSCAWATGLAAQDLRRTAPPAPVAPAPAPLATPSPEPRRPADPNQVVVAELKGLRLVAGPGEPRPTGQSAEGVSSDIAFAAPVAPELQAFLGKPLTLGALARIEAVVIGYYRVHHRPFVNVAAPPQDVSSGIVQIVVTEYKVGAVRVLKNRWFAASLVRDAVRLKPGDPIDSTRLEADLAWLNQNPFLNVDAITRPGAQAGETDIDLMAHDHFPISVYAGYANNGSPATGLEQWKFGALWGNAFGTGQQLAYQFTASPDFFTGRAARPDGSTGASFMAHALTATIQLPWRNTLQLIGDYETDHPNIGPDFARTGYSSQASVRYIIPLPPARRFSQQLSFGYDFKSTNNNLDFGGVAVSGQSTEIDQFPITYQATRGDRWGQTSLADTLVLSPGGL